MDNVPKKGPVIFAVNHQNSFLDALLVTTTTPRNPYYLARGDVFGISWISYLLNFINIMPIYRSRDGIKNIRKNEAIIDRKLNDAVENALTLSLTNLVNNAKQFA